MSLELSGNGEIIFTPNNYDPEVDRERLLRAGQALLNCFLDSTRYFEVSVQEGSVSLQTTELALGNFGPVDEKVEMILNVHYPEE